MLFFIVPVKQLNILLSYLSLILFKNTYLSPKNNILDVMAA